MKGVVFSNAMVCQLLRRHKTQTRRLNRLGKIGQVLYVKEAFALGEADTVDYKVTTDPESYLFEDLQSWSNRRYMPENCARMFVQLKRVWQERLCAISEEDAQKEGFVNRDQFLNYWTHLHHGGFYDPTNGRIYYEEKKIDCDVWAHEFDVFDRKDRQEK